MVSTLRNVVNTGLRDPWEAKGRSAEISRFSCMMTRYYPVRFPSVYESLFQLLNCTHRNPLLFENTQATEHYTVRKLDVTRTTAMSAAAASSNGGGSFEGSFGSNSGGGNGTREVVQIQYTSWPDRSAPSEASALLQLIEVRVESGWIRVLFLCTVRKKKASCSLCEIFLLNSSME